MKKLNKSKKSKIKNIFIILLFSIFCFAGKESILSLNKFHIAAAADVLVPAQEEFISAFLSCKGVPLSVVDDLNEKPENFIGNYRFRYSGNAQNIYSPVMTLVDVGSCDFEKCNTHFFANDISSVGCRYVFSIKLNRDITSSSSIVKQKKDKYQAECEVYFNGVCFFSDGS